jgi:hypothetical protein
MLRRRKERKCSMKKEETGGRKRVAVMKELRSDVRKEGRGGMNQVVTYGRKECSLKEV